VLRFIKLSEDEKMNFFKKLKRENYDHKIPLFFLFLGFVESVLFSLAFLIFPNKDSSYYVLIPIMCGLFNVPLYYFFTFFTNKMI
jgi:hypothetical protein